MNDAVQTALARLAPILRGLRRSPEATISYCVMSDALIWSDETPEFRVPGTFKDWHVLRFVFHYRTQLILGEPEQRDPDPDGLARLIFAESRDAWHEARRLFPEWPGFQPERFKPELRSMYESLCAESK
jgi:hypothetical protein